MLLQIDGTFIVIAISFLIFMFLMHIVFYAPMLKMKKERRDYINSNKRHTQTMSDSANDLKDEYEVELKQAHSIAKEIIDEKTQKANEQQEISIQECHQKAKRALEGAKSRIAKSQEELENNLESDINMLRDEIVSKILGSER